MDKATAISLVEQQHALEECAERLGRRERMSLITGLFGMGIGALFLIGDVLTGRYSTRGIIDLLIIFCGGAASYLHSRRCRRDREALENEAAQMRGRQQPIDKI